MHRQSISPRHIEYFEKQFLDNQGGIVDASALMTTGMGRTGFFKIIGLADFWESSQRQAFSLRFLMEDLLSGLYESSIPIIFSVLGGKSDVEVLIGTFAQDINNLRNNLGILKSSLISSFHGIEMKSLVDGSFENRIGSFKRYGLVTGTPSDKRIEGRIEVTNIERLMRGVYGKDCSFTVIGTPLDNNSINAIYNSVLNEMRIISDSERHMGQENPVGKRYRVLLEQYLKKLESAKAQGLWNTLVLLYSDILEDLNHLKAISKSTFSGRESIPDRIRVFSIRGPITFPGMINNPAPSSPGQFIWPHSYMSIIGTNDLSNYVHFPSEEIPGFSIKPYARFNVSLEESKKEGVGIGEVLDQGQKLGFVYKIPIKDLKKHGLVVGTTGSGKTNTLFYMLKELWRQDTPFLVIEPAKTEYRKLLYSQEFGKDLQVFTLGDNNISPFRLNPFEIIPGISVQTHIDLLKSVFNSSFFMWGPLPHVLERCLHEIYVDKGWDLSSNKNSRGIHKYANPTLTDLYNKVDEVVDSLGYSPETTMELKSSLKTRINSLRIGGKGLMLDTNSSIKFEKLLSKPTVLELETLGDDDEKSFLMGIILTILYEHYVSQGFSEGKDLGHITVIEEAHRLLSNYVSDNQYTGDMKGKAVETFTNILSEIRAYGEGFLIAEQIPTKLSPDVVKNTNLKVMHRIVSEDDRKIMTATMNIEEKESRKVTSLGIGEAVVYSEGDDGAYHIKVPYAKIGNGEGDDEQLIIKTMSEYTEDPDYIAPYRSCTRYCKSICDYKNLGEIINSKERFYSPLIPLTLSIIDGAGHIDSFFMQMLEEGNDESRRVNDPMGVKTCAIIQGVERFYEYLGRKYGWAYNVIEELKNSFLDLYKSNLAIYLENGIIKGNEEGMIRFRNVFRALCKEKQPTPLCPMICTDKHCQYRFLLEDTLEDEYYHNKFVDVVNESGTDLWEQLDQVCKEAARELHPDGTPSTIRKLSLCYALQKSYSISDLSKRHIDRIINNLLEINPIGNPS